MGISGGAASAITGMKFQAFVHVGIDSAPSLFSCNADVEWSILTVDQSYWPRTEPAPTVDLEDSTNLVCAS